MPDNGNEGRLSQLFYTLHVQKKNKTGLSMPDSGKEGRLSQLFYTGTTKYDWVQHARQREGGQALPGILYTKKNKIEFSMGDSGTKN
jgi:hypothetical protein